MRFRSSRQIEPEILDDLSPGEGAASLRDIVRINRLTGGHKVLRLALDGLVTGPFSVLDVGSATGDAASEIRRLYPEAHVVSLDYRLHHVHPAPPPRLAADAFRLPFRRDSFDIVYCGLFLHHFSDDEVVELLRGFADVARRYVVVNDLERHVLPYWFLPATRWLFRWDPITLHDGPISVQAAFTRGELQALSERAGLHVVRARAHRPAFRVSLVARAPDAKLGV